MLERARAEGVSLVGPGGLLQQVTRTVLQTALEAEMAEHLGYERGETPPPGSGNHRNGSSPKTVRTEVGDVRLDVPRDRQGTFAPAIVPKHARRLEGFDEAIISLYAKGLTTGRSRRTWPRSTTCRFLGTWWYLWGGESEPVLLQADSEPSNDRRLSRTRSSKASTVMPRPSNATRPADGPARPTT